MTDTIRRIAVVMAATEVLPAEWRDLSDLLLETGGPEQLLSEGTLDSARETELWRYMRNSIDVGRISYWERCLRQLWKTHPSVTFVSAGESDYPNLLKCCYDRPPFIFIDGSIISADSRSLAIVGSRDADDEATSIARQAAQIAVEAGITVVSGLAKGIDGAAHRGALASRGRTIAAIASGIDYRTYPSEHAQLAQKIRSEGALVSQFRPGSPPTRSSFVMRNSVISGLARVSLMVQGGEQSGTRTEAESAIRQGRPVYLWGPLVAKESWARRAALEPGVVMVSNLEDVIRAVDAV